MKVATPVKRVPIPLAIQTRILLANRHACCVCQKSGVQLHHIDGNPSNNSPDNIASLCLSHHDQASMQIGLTKKLQPSHVKTYKNEWEAQCVKDIKALSRFRFTFYYCIYKNPQRIREALRQLSPLQRANALRSLAKRLAAEDASKKQDSWFGMNAVPNVDEHTRLAMKSIHDGEDRPSYLGQFEPHPADPDYSRDCSTQEAMAAYHLYDLWCQVAAQTLAEVHGATPIEDLYAMDDEEQLDPFIGKLVSFRLSVYGKNIHLPSYWQQHPVGTLSARKKVDGRVFRVRMQLRTMYLFSDTAAINLARGRVSGVGLFNGATENDDGEIELTIVPLLIGAGGWTLHPEGFPASYSSAFADAVATEK